jgi:hypothetical protein
VKALNLLRPGHRVVALDVAGDPLSMVARNRRARPTTMMPPEGDPHRPEWAHAKQPDRTPRYASARGVRHSRSERGWQLHGPRGSDIVSSLHADGIATQAPIA